VTKVGYNSPGFGGSVLALNLPRLSA